MSPILLLALAFAAPAAALILWPWLGRTASPAAAGDDERAALDTEKMVALRAIRELDLDHEAGQLSGEDYAVLRERAEAQAAAILRKLDALAPAAEAPRRADRARGTPADRGPEPAVPWTRRPAVLAVGGLGLVAFGVALGLLVSRFTAPAPPEATMAGAEPTPGPVAPALPGPAGVMTPPGGPGTGSTGGPPRPIPPEMLQGMLQAAHQSLDAGRYQEAIAAYTAVLRRQPTNVDAITHLGVILSLAGHADNALEAFAKALSIEPDYAHALWDKGRVLAEQKQDDRGAIAAWEHFLRVASPGPDRAQAEAWIKAARARLASGPRPVAPAARP